MALFGTSPSSGNTLLQTASTAISVAANSSRSSTLTVSGGTAPYTWDVVAGSLPTGYILQSSGVLTGNATSTQVSTFTAQVRDSLLSTATDQYRFEVLSTAEAALVITNSTDLSTGSTFASYGDTLVATGGVSPYTFSGEEAVFPAGLTMNSAGVISGTPTSSGTSTLTLQVTDNAGSTASKAFRIQISSVLALGFNDSTLLETGSTGSAYARQLTSTGGVPAVTFSTTAGTDLPAGLSISSSGLISGTPTSSGTSTFTIQITDNAGSTADQAFSHTISSVSTNVHAYFNDLSTRAEAFLSYSLRDNSTLQAMSQGGGSAGSVTYGFSTDVAYHHPQDAARILIPKGSGDLPQQVFVPLVSSQRETGNWFMVHDVFLSSLWNTERFSSLAVEELRAHKFGWLRAHPNGNFGSNKTDFIKTVNNYSGLTLPQVAAIHFAVKFTEVGDGVVSEPLAPQASTFTINAKTWTRYFFFLDMNAGSSNDLLSIWMADENRDAVKLIDGLVVEQKFNSSIDGAMIDWNLRLDTSQFRSTHGADIIGYWRNLVFLRNIADPLPFLKRPLGHSTGSS